MPARVSYEQLETLWGYLNTNKEIAMGANKSLQDRERARKLWAEISKAMNSIVGGAVKDSKGWASYWIDYKGKIKKKRSLMSRDASQSDTGLSEIEIKYLDIIGEEKNNKSLPIVKTDPLDMDITNASSTSETFQMFSPPIVEVEHIDVASDNAGTSQPEVVSVIEIPFHLEPIKLESSKIDTEANIISAPKPIIPSVTRKRKRNRGVEAMTQEAARRSIVESSRQRAETSQATLAVLERIAESLSSISSVLSRLENRLN